MTKWQDKLDNLWVETQQAIIDKVKQIGVESEFSTNKVIKVDTKKIETDLGHRGGYLFEVSTENLIDNNGYEYGYGYLDHEQLAELADWVEELK